MNNRKSLILVTPGLALLLLLSLRSVLASAIIDVPAALNEATIGVAKIPSEQAILLGESATFTIYITNTGASEATLTVEDPLGDSNCLTPPVNPLPAGASTSYTCTTTGPTADFTNVIDVTGTYDDSTTAQASASAAVEVVDAAIDLSLLPASQVVPHNGTAGYEIVILNEGAVDLALSAEALFGEDNCQPGVTSLAPGGTTNYGCIVSNVTGDFTDVVKITGSHTTVNGNLVEVSDSAQPSVLSEPLIMVTNTADPDTVAEPGGEVTYSVTISSAGDDDVTLVSLEDDKFGDLLATNNGSVSANNCPDIVIIGGGGLADCSFKVQVTGQPGNHTSTVTALVEEVGSGLQTSADGSATVTIENVASSIVTTLTAVPTSVTAPGGNVAFTVNVENTSAVDTVTINALTGSPLLGNMNGKGDCSLPRTLVVGDSYQCSVTVMVSGAPDETKNFTAMASGKDDDDVEVADASNQVQITITEPPPIKVFLPVALHNFIPDDTDEPNNACAQAHGIVTNADYNFLPNDKEDWYRFNLASSGNLRVELTNFVPVQGQIILYKGSCGSLQFLQNNGNFLPTKTINRPVTAGTFYVRIITDGPFSTTSYSLRVGFP